MTNEQLMETLDKLADAQVEVGERTTLLEEALVKIGRGLEMITDAHKVRIVELEDSVTLLEDRIALVERS